MREYLINITICVIITSIIENFCPNVFSKYIKMICGMILMITIIMPIKRIKIPEFSHYQINAQDYEESAEKITQKSVIKELEKRVGEDIKNRLYEEFSMTCEVMVRLDVNSCNEITGVNMVYIKSKNVPQKVVKRIEEIYAPKEITFE